MLYENYEKRILKVQKFLLGVKKYRFLIIAVAFVLLLAIGAFVFFKGAMTADLKGDLVYTYGEQISVSGAKCFCGRAEYEFSSDGGSSWNKESPLLPGHYSVRAVSKRAFGRKDVGKPVSLKINRKAVEIGYEDKRPLYDAKDVGIYASLVGGDEITNYELECNYFSKRDAEVIVKKASLKVRNKDGKDVTEAYEFQIEKYRLLLDKMKLVIKATDAEKVYDGQPLFSDRYEMTEGKLADGETIVATPNRSITDVGTIDNELILKIFDSKLADVTDDYEITYVAGELKVSKRSVKLIVPVAEKVYDGTYDIAAEAATAGDGEYPLVSGHFAACEIKADRKDIRAANGKITSFGIYDEEGVEVTENYSVEYSDCNVSILKREIIIAPNDYERIYDGTKKVDVKISATMDSPYDMADDHVIEGESEADRNDVYASKSIIKVYTIYDENREDVTGNYDVTVRDGALHIAPKPIKVALFERRKQYDGSVLSVPGANDFWLPNDKTVDGDFVEKVYNIVTMQDGTETRAVKVGEYLSVGEAKIVSASGKDMSYCYEAECSGAMIIEKRIVRFTVDEKNGGYSFSDLRCVYNGLLSGHNFVAPSETFDSVEKLLSSVIIYDRLHNDVSENYLLEYVESSD